MLSPGKCLHSRNTSQRKQLGRAISPEPNPRGACISCAFTASQRAAPALPLLWGAGEVPRSRGEAGGCLGCAPWGAEALRGPQRPPRGGQRRQECARRPARNATLVSCYFGSRGPGPLRAPPAPPGAHISPSYCVASEICYFKPAGRRYVSARGADTSQPAVTF